MSIRIEKINSEIKKVISHIINFELFNPKLKGLMISVVDVDTTTDLEFSKVYVSVFPEQENDEVINTLKTCIPFIRRTLAKKINLRYTPKLLFFLDNSMKNASHIDDLIHNINKAKKV